MDVGRAGTKVDVGGESGDNAHTEDDGGSVCLEEFVHSGLLLTQDAGV